MNVMTTESRCPSVLDRPDLKGVAGDCRRIIVGYRPAQILGRWLSRSLFTDLEFHSTLGSLAHPDAWRPIVAGVRLDTPFTFSQPTFFMYRWTGSEPPGAYRLFIAAVKSGALGDNSIDRGDIVVLSTAAMEFAP